MVIRWGFFPYIAFAGMEFIQVISNPVFRYGPQPAQEIAFVGICEFIQVPHCAHKRILHEVDGFELGTKFFTDAEAY